MSLVSAAKATALGLQSEFDAIYRQTGSTQPQWLKDLFATVTSDGAYEHYHLYEAVPRPLLWHRGDPRAEQTFGEADIKVYNKDWQLKINWHENDELDDRTGEGLVARAREGARRFAQLDERIAQVLITGTVDPDTFAPIPTCVDGNAFYSTSHAMVSGGNLVSGSGVDTVDHIKADWWTALKRFRDMLDTAGEPYWDVALLDQARFLVLCAPANEERFFEAFKSEWYLPSGGTAPTVNLLPRRDRSQIVTWNRISGNDWYVFLLAPDRAPFIKQERQPLRQVEWNLDNSDLARDTKVKAVGWDWRGGYGYLNYFTGIKVDN